MEDQVRKYQGADQQDLFPEADPPTNRYFYVVGVAVVALIVALLFGVPAMAQSQPMVLNKAAICDTEDQAKELIDVLSSADVSQITPINVEGCGYLQRPTPAIVTPLGVYENKYVKVLMATMDIPGLGIQYGYLAWEAKPPETDI